MTPGLLLAILAAGQTPPAPPRFVAHSAGAEPAVGTVEAVGRDWAVALADPKRAVPPGDLIELKRADVPLPPWPDEPFALLANGDRIPGTVAGGDGQSLRFAAATPAPAAWSIPIPYLSVVWLVKPPADTAADPAGYPWLDPKRRSDVLLFRNGDVQGGILEGFAADGKAVRFKPAGERAADDIALSRLAAVAFNPSLTTTRRPRGRSARVVTANGTRATVVSVTADATTVAAATQFGAKWEFPLSDFVGLSVFGGKATYLSDLKPKADRHDPFGDVAWPARTDRGVKGDPLRLAGPRGVETFDKGLGLHPRTTLRYDLAGRYRRFEGVVGLDPVSGRRGAVDVRVLVDGTEQPLPKLVGLTLAAGPQPVRVDVTKAKELTLVLDFGPAGDVQDDVSWADARLVE